MKIKGFIILIVVIILLIIGIGAYVIYSLNNNAPESSEEMISYTEEKVETYLINEKDYTKDEIASIESKKEPKTSDSTASDYSVEVTFSDEPNAIYFYEVKNDKVYQFGTSGNAKKHNDQSS